MEAVPDRPLFTRYHDDLDSFSPAPGAAYVYAASTEERTTFPDNWIALHRNRGVRFIEIVEQDHERANFRVRSIDSGYDATISLRSREQLNSFFQWLHSGLLYIDITGQDQTTWSNLLRTALALRLDTAVVYTEPSEYKYSPAPVEGNVFDLSERIRGIETIPGFTTFQNGVDDFVMIPLLGFEGPRFAFLIDHLQPDTDDIYPIIGLPGFRPEYVFHAYWCNKTSLLATRSYRQVRYARANCPFSAFHIISDIAHRNAGRPLRLAPIGTKPHALGAVLYLLANASSGTPVELVYDHPIRKAKRTSGTATVAVYYVSSFLPAI